MVEFQRKEYVPARRQMFVLNSGSYVSSLGTTKKPLTIRQALRLLNQLEIQFLENYIQTQKENK